MKQVKVIWFNKNKDFGEGVDRQGNKIFLTGSSFVGKKPSSKKQEMLLVDVIEDPYQNKPYSRKAIVIKTTIKKFRGTELFYSKNKA